MSKLSDEQIIRMLDEVEADLRRHEHRLYRVREALRERVDPYKQRNDLGYWEDEPEVKHRAEYLICFPSCPR